MRDYCLCCGRKLNEDEKEQGYHLACLRKLFPYGKIPSLELTKENIDAIARESLMVGEAVPGVQEKLSLHISRSKEKRRLTIVGKPTGYILKPPSEKYPFLPESENLVMSMAEAAGIPVCPHGLMESKDHMLCYITKRIDRDGDKKIAMEDFCQLSELPSLDKYRTSYESCGKIIDRYSYMPIIDKQNFYYEVLFCFITLNNDMHLKNFSLYEKRDGFFKLTPAYDLLPSGLVNPKDDEEMALALNGKKKGITRKDILALAFNLGISEKVASGFIKRLLDLCPAFEDLIAHSLLSEKLKADFTKALRERLSIIR